MTNVSLKDQLTTMANNDYPFVRRDKEVRARLLESFLDADGVEQVIIETIVPKKEPCKRVVTVEYWENNYWEGKD